MKNYLNLALRVFLGLIMIYGGVQKFQAPKLSTADVIEKVEKYAAPEHQAIAQKVLYISGAKQTGYFWELLGICELLFGLMLLLKPTSLIGALLLLPISLQILLFHWFLEQDEWLGLLESSGIMLANLIVLFFEKDRLKPLLIQGLQKSQ